VLANLMPKHPVYTAMLPESARAVIGLPHPSGRAAMRMLEAEGFHHDHYIDLFDGGPTMTAFTDRIRSVAEARDALVVRIGAVEQGEKLLAARGRLTDFIVAYAQVVAENGGIALDPAGAAALGVVEGDTVVTIPR